MKSFSFVAAVAIMAFCMSDAMAQCGCTASVAPSYNSVPMMTSYASQGCGGCYSTSMAPAVSNCGTCGTYSSYAPSCGTSSVCGSSCGTYTNSCNTCRRVRVRRGSTCGTTCGSTCGTSYASTCGSTCGTSYASTCGTSYASTCGSTCGTNYGSSCGTYTSNCGRGIMPIAGGNNCGCGMSYSSMPVTVANTGCGCGAVASGCSDCNAGAVPTTDGVVVEGGAAPVPAEETVPAEAAAEDTPPTPDDT